MFNEYVRSWEIWMRSGKGARRLTAWAACDDALRGWSGAELRSPLASPRTDAMQAALVGLAQRADAYAVATLVVQMRPGLTTLANRAIGFDPRLADRTDATAEVLSAFGEVVLRHPLDRRPDKIAANLLLDTRQQLWRAGRRAVLVAEAAELAARCGGSAAGLHSHDPSLRAEELDLIASVTDAIGALPGDEGSRRLTAQLAYRSWFLDESSHMIADDLGMGPEAVRVRLCRLRAVVRQRRRSVGYEEMSFRPGSAPPSSPVGPSLASRQ